MAKKQGPSGAEKSVQKATRTKTEAQRPVQIHTTEMIAMVARKTGLTTKVVETVLREASVQINEALVSGARFRWTPVGIFSVVERKGRSGRNPRTGERMEIPASKGIRFKPAKPLLDKVQEA